MKDGAAQGQGALPLLQYTLGIISLFVTISTVYFSRLGALPYILD